MGKTKIGFYVIIFLLFAVLLMSLAEAGFWGTITGKATSQPTNVSVSVTGANPAVINYVAPIPNTNPIEATSKTITFEVHMYDADGVNDLNDSSVSSNFSKTSQTTRTSGACSWVNDINANTANYSCSITMWYWDGSGAWNINVKGNDIGNTTWQYNTSTTFTYNENKAMIISPASLTWPSLTGGSTNQKSNNAPTVINNTGNYNGTISITAINLLGQTVPSDMITASNFTSSSTNSTVCASGTQLVNSTSTTLAGTNSNPGNLSAGSSAGQANIYYCLPSVPYISSQIYSTQQGGSWTISY